MFEYTEKMQKMREFAKWITENYFDYVEEWREDYMGQLNLDEWLRQSYPNIWREYELFSEF